MSKKSKTSSRKVLEKPLAPAALKRAKKIAATYRIILEPSERLGYIGTAVEFPTVFAEGKTPDKCVAATRQALAYGVATIIEEGQEPPSAASEKRDTQVNIRLTATEKVLLREAARRSGFEGISEFVRYGLLNSIFSSK